MLRALMLPTQALVCVLPLSLPAPAARAQEITERDRAAAQVIYDTIRVRRGVGAPDEATILDYKRACADDAGDSYCFANADVRDASGGPYTWSCRIEFLPEGWTPDREAERRWEQRFLREDGATGARIYHQVNAEHPGTPSRVSFKLRRGRTQIILQETRGGGPGAEEHLRLALPRWRFFVEDAEAQGLFAPAAAAAPATRLRVVLGPTGWSAGGEVTDGQVVSFDHDLARAADVPLSIHVDPPGAAQGERPIARVRLDAEGRRETTVLARGRPLQPGPDGAFEVPLDAAGPAELVVRFRPREPSPGEPIGQSAGIAISGPSLAAGPTVILKLGLTLHRSDWVPVVRRFEIVQRGTGTRRGAEGESDDPLLGRGWSFNEYRIHGGNEVAAWKGLEPVARIRPSLEEDAPGGRLMPGHPDPVYAAEERVLLGWKIDRATFADFLTAESGPEAPPTLASWLQNATQAAVIELWMARDPAPPSGGSGAVAPSGGAADERRQEQAELRRRIYVEELQVEVVRVSSSWAGIRGAEEEALADTLARELADLLRLPAGGEPFSGRSGPPKITVLARDPARQRLSDYEAEFPIDGASFDHLFQCREPGVYEARLIMDLRTEEQATPRRVRCAVRFNVVPVGFSPRVLYWSSERR
jgi:hypothetical protein